jgi:uncharacterized protein YrzB (UPF0473 family)
MEWMDGEKAKMLRVFKEHYGEEACHLLVKVNGEETRKNYAKRAEELGDNSIEVYVRDQWEHMPDYGFELTISKSESEYAMHCPNAP